MFNAVCFRKSEKCSKRGWMLYENVSMKISGNKQNSCQTRMSEAETFFFLMLNCLFSTNHIHLCIFVDVSGIYLHCIQNSLWDFGMVGEKKLHKNLTISTLLCYRFIYSAQEIWMKFENYINTTRIPATIQSYAK